MESEKKESVKLQLTKEQLKLLSSYAKELSKGELVIELFDEDEQIGEMKAAECGYYSDSCCV
jgi:hypothetical protein